MVFPGNVGGTIVARGEGVKDELQEGTKVRLTHISLLSTRLSDAAGRVIAGRRWQRRLRRRARRFAGTRPRRTGVLYEGP